jgi:hypothetical protein
MFGEVGEALTPRSGHGYLQVSSMVSLGAQLNRAEPADIPSHVPAGPLTAKTSPVGQHGPDALSCRVQEVSANGRLCVFILQMVLLRR